MVVWAHCVLGLTVVVESQEGVVRFGEGSESVYIEYLADVALEACLYNETQVLLFNIIEPNQDTVLEPVCRHPFLGYGHRVIELTLNDDYLLSQAITQAVITSCIGLQLLLQAKYFAHLYGKSLLWLGYCSQIALDFQLVCPGAIHQSSIRHLYG